MLAQSFTRGREDSPFSLMQKKEQRMMIRKAVSSDLSKEIESYKLRISNEVEEEIKIMMSKSSLVVEEEEEEEEEEIECSCCGLKEECTKSYILEVQKSFSGNWVCGLCSEAVKERLFKFPNTTIDKALNFHREFCDSFNTTTRLNPKLSLTTSMRKIARKSFENRTNNLGPSSSSNNKNKLSRSISCDPRIGLQDSD
ncbi:uncharacterized protein LOC120086851 [Benincasa hispida]|uniref:uncharacterized protein LOC120086851 n=1 Tax=Benincasa hispida TaxID=102211 RepID=UPI0018FF3515|nr:uncharacterized protein LOC120086851 [Benincasa hispida]